MGYSFVVTWILAKLVDKTIGFRASEDDETSGVDMALPRGVRVRLQCAGRLAVGP